MLILLKLFIFILSFLCVLKSIYVIAFNKITKIDFVGQVIALLYFLLVCFLSLL